MIDQIAHRFKLNPRQVNKLPALHDRARMIASNPGVSKPGSPPIVPDPTNNRRPGTKPYPRPDTKPKPSPGTTPPSPSSNSTDKKGVKKGKRPRSTNTFAAVMGGGKGYKKGPSAEEALGVKPKPKEKPIGLGHGGRAY